MSHIHSVTTAEKLLENLAAFYETYQKASEKLEAEETGVSIFGGWFGGGRGIVNDRMHMEFYNAVEKRRDLLVTSLNSVQQEAPAEAHRLAKAAVDIILRPIPDRFRDVGGWMRFAAEPLCEPLLKWLSREELTAIRKLYVDTYPKRKMFRTQKDLLKTMDALLAEKTP